MRSADLYYLGVGWLTTSFGRSVVKLLDNPKNITWEKLGEITGFTDQKSLLLYTEFFLSKLHQGGYLLSDKENHIIKRLFGSETHYKNIEKILKEKEDNYTIEEYTKWRNSVTDKYSFTRKIPMSWAELGEWGKEQEKKKEDGLKLINPDFQ